MGLSEDAGTALDRRITAVAAAVSSPAGTIALGLFVALLGWHVVIVPPFPGLDMSWNAGLAMAAKDGLDAGTEIVFSYGPLGFLRVQGVWYEDLAVAAFLYGTALYLALCVAVVWTLRRLLPWPAALLLAFPIVVLPAVEQALVVAVLVGMGALAEKRSQRTISLIAICGASFAAVESLGKLSIGPLIAVFFLLVLVGMRARWWQLVGFLVLFGGEFLLFWLTAEQSLATIPDFVRNGYEVVSGYGEAMTRLPDIPAWQADAATLLAVLIGVALVVMSVRSANPDPRARWAGAVVMGLAAFAAFKQGVVRLDAAHLTIYFSTACVLWLAVPWRRDGWRWMLAGALGIGLIGVPLRPPVPNNLNPVENVALAAEQISAVLSDSRRRELRAAGRAGMKAVYRLEPATLAALRGHSVATDPWEIGVAWAYELDWEPLPVMQNYAAYTSALDGLNAAAVRDGDGPERILRENPALVLPEFQIRAIDYRFPGWEPPAQARAVLCHFVPLRTTDRWQVLGRVPNRCNPPRLVRAVTVRAGTPVPVPAPGPQEVVFARVEGAEVAGWERLVELFLRARTRHALLDGTQSYQLVPGTAADGLLLRGSIRIGGSGAFAQIPNARTIAVTGTGGDVGFRFFVMRVSRAIPAAARIARRDLHQPVQERQPHRDRRVRLQDPRVPARQAW